MGEYQTAPDLPPLLVSLATRVSSLERTQIRGTAGADSRWNTGLILATGWTAGTHSPRYYRQGGFVYLAGKAVKTGTDGGQQVFTLPAPYHPAFLNALPVAVFTTASGYAGGVIVVGADGIVTLQSLGASVPQNTSLWLTTVPVALHG